jgi:maltose alpha-D-glucosyltransferase/alpha-amylase
MCVIAWGGWRAGRRGRRRAALVQGRGPLRAARPRVLRQQRRRHRRLPGLAQKLDYLQDLGVSALWLLPFYPSPLKDDGYDIANYTAVHPSYGDLRDFRMFLKEAHRRNLRVVTEMVLNHTSDQHPWFQRARRAPAGSAWRDFYVWSDTPERYKEARIIFQDFETSNWSWDPLAKAYYWHRFYSHQPDLNFENPKVRQAMIQAVDFWMGKMGVDGLRLDAVPYLYERDGTNCENLPETHAFLRELRRHVDEKYPGRMLLAEANQWPEDAVAYFGGGTGDECHTAFHFPLMPRMFVGIQTEDRFPIVDMLEQTPPIPETSQWVLFLRNHDELTLEMVSDEERDYMYRAYAQDPQARINLGIRRRLAPLLGNSRRKIELMTALLLSLPGTPVIYYGDELGMGDNYYLGDRNGVRTPMQWSPDRNAGFSRANSQRLYLPAIIDPEYHYEAINVDVQQNNPQSLLWWTKRVLDLRRRRRAFGRGTLEMVFPENRKVLAFLRRWGDERLLVVANLSRFAQHAELNLATHRGHVPLELFGQTEFPVIGEGPYPLSLGPHGFYWFELRPPRGGAGARAAAAPRELARVRVPELRKAGRDATSRAAIEAVLPEWLYTRPWFQGQGRRVQSLKIVEAVPVTPEANLLVARVDYTEGESEAYALPLGVATGRRAEEMVRKHPHAVVARLDAAAGRRRPLRRALGPRVLRGAAGHRGPAADGQGGRGRAGGRLGQPGPAHAASGEGAPPGRDRRRARLEPRGLRRPLRARPSCGVSRRASTLTWRSDGSSRSRPRSLRRFPSWARSSTGGAGGRPPRWPCCAPRADRRPTGSGTRSITWAASSNRYWPRAVARLPRSPRARARSGSRRAACRPWPRSVSGRS